MHQEHRDLTGLHLLLERGKRGVSIACLEVGTEAHRLADVAGHIVQDVDGGADLRGAGVLAADAAGHRQARLGRRELPGQQLDLLGRQSGLLRDLFRRVRREHAPQRHRIRRRAAPLRQDHLRH